MNYQSLTDSICHDFPSSKTHGLRLSQSRYTQQYEISQYESSEFPSIKHRTKIPYMSFKAKTQFIKTKQHPYHFYQDYKFLQKEEITEVGSILKPENTVFNSYVSSSSKMFAIKSRKPPSQCPSPIKGNQEQVNKVNQQMINVLMKMMERMQKMDKDKEQQTQKNQRQQYIQLNNSRQKNRNNSMERSLKRSHHYHSYIPEQSIIADQNKPQIVINNIIKGKSDLSENKQSRIYDIMDFELRKQEDMIRKLQMEKQQQKRQKMRYRTPDITQFEIDIQRLDKKIKDQPAPTRINNFLEDKSDISTPQQEISIKESRNQNISKTNSQQSTRFPLRQRHRIKQPLNKQIKEPSFTQPNNTFNEAKTQSIVIQYKKAEAFDFPISANQDKQNISLAQAFQKRKQYLSSSRPKQLQKRQKSKQQLFQIRKNMMKRRPTYSSKPQSIDVTIIQSSANTSMKLSKRQPSKQLLDRLISGTKVPIDRKQMRALTQKNYQRLPQVKQKRDQKRKKQQFEIRMAQKREYQKSIRKHR